MLSVCLLALWLTSQMPWLLGAFFFLHGPHEVSVKVGDHGVEWIFCHQPADAESAEQHHDHVIALALDEPANRPGSTGAGALCLPVLLLAGRDIMFLWVPPAPTPLPTARAAISPSLLAMRTVVLMV